MGDLDAIIKRTGNVVAQRELAELRRVERWARNLVESWQRGGPNDLLRGTICAELEAAVMASRGLRPDPRPGGPVVSGVCRECGCTDSTPCIEEAQQAQGGVFVTTPCHWVEPDLCSSCAAISLTDDPLELLGEEDDPEPLLYDAFDRPIDIGGRR